MKGALVGVTVVVVLDPAKDVTIVAGVEVIVESDGPETVGVTESDVAADSELRGVALEALLDKPLCARHTAAKPSWEQRRARRIAIYVLW